MKRSLLFFGILSLTAGVEASTADLSWGDPTLDSGQFKVSGAVRSRYLHIDYVVDANEGSQNDDWRLTDIKLVLGYENKVSDCGNHINLISKLNKDSFVDELVGCDIRYK